MTFNIANKHPLQHYIMCTILVCSVKSALAYFSMQWNFVFNHVFVDTMNMENSGPLFLESNLPAVM